MKKLDALEIILAAPLWARREDMPQTGFALYDDMVENAKPYALAVAEERPRDAMSIASRWTSLLNQFLDSHYIKDCESSQKMLAVYKHYIDAMGFGLLELEGK